jgi:hypothetical protein
LREAVRIAFFRLILGTCFSTAFSLSIAILNGLFLLCFDKNRAVF